MSPSKEWHIDLVQHLRTTHFVLLLLGCGLISVGVGYNSSAATALPAVDQVSNFCSSWPNDWIETLRPRDNEPPPSFPLTLYFNLPPGPDYYARNKGKNGFSTTGNLLEEPPRKVLGENNTYVEEMPLITEGLTGIRLTLDKPLQFWRALRLNEKESYEPVERSSLYLERAPSTLSEFQEWWDTTNNLHIDYFSIGSPAAGSLKREKDPESVLLKLSPWMPEKQIKTVPKEDVTSVKFVPAPEIRSETRDLTTDPVIIVDMRLRYGNPARLVARALFAGSQKKVKPGTLNPDVWRRRSGSFVEAFPELQGLPVGLSIQRFDSLRKKLEQDAAEPQTFDLIGLKFQVARWGILLILMIQGYFLILLRELDRSVTAGEVASLDVAWIGLFTSRVGRLAFLCSLLVPAVAVYVLARHLLPLYFQLGLTILSLSLSVLIFLKVPTRCGVSHSSLRHF